ncbi:MAG: hypothetical protein RJA87_2357 [Pseudomonadota bacterium]|jgi:heme oxygenase
MTDPAVIDNTPSVLIALRAATAESHKTVERLTPFFRPDFGRDGYLKWLHLMHGFYGVAEQAIACSDFGLATGWSYTSRRDLIERDLEMLSAPKAQPQSDRGEVLKPLQQLHQTAEIAGMLYVIEGSALGGNVLQKMLHRKAKVTPQLGASFFAPHGDDPNARWRDFVQLLSKLGTTPDMERDIVDGAVVTFNALQDWIIQSERTS